MIGIVLLVVVAARVFWFVGVYNSLISLRNQVFNAWKQIDVQLKRRHDLIPNLVETVKGAMNFEKETLESVIAARNQAIAATRGTTDLPSPQQVQATAAAEGQLSSSLSRLFAVVEAYPGSQGHRQRRAAAGRAHVHGEQDRVRAPALQRSGDGVQHAPAAVPRQPRRRASSKATPAQLWEITDAAEREVVKVDLSMNAKK